MSKVADKQDTLENLSNAELRAKCIQYGLPNVPVTDSSRNVLMKKLRVSMGGTTPAGAASSNQPTKKTNRRETIHVVASKAAVVVDAAPPPAAADAKEQQVAPPPSRLNNRRTIATTTSIVAKDHQPPTEVAATVVLSGIPAPIGNRRRSSVREQPLPASQAVPTAPIKNRPVVILESDDEDDIDLVLAAQKAELTSFTQEQRNKPASRAASLSKTSVRTSSYQQASPPPLQEETEIIGGGNFGSSAMIQNATRKLPTVEPLATRRTFIPPPSSAILGASTDRYSIDAYGAVASQRHYSSSQDASAYYSPTLRRSAATTTSSITTSSKQYSQPRVSAATTAAYYNEQSDDTDTGGANADEPIRTPFLSNFARSLERVKAEPLGGGIGSAGGGIRSGALFGGSDAVADLAQRRYKRSTKPYEGGARQPINQQQQDASLVESLRQLFAALERKYHLKRNLALLLLILMIVFLFVVFWQ